MMASQSTFGAHDATHIPQEPYILASTQNTQSHQERLSGKDPEIDEIKRIRADITNLWKNYGRAPSTQYPSESINIIKGRIAQLKNQGHAKSLSNQLEDVTSQYFISWQLPDGLLEIAEHPETSGGHSAQTTSADFDERRQRVEDRSEDIRRWENELEVVCKLSNRTAELVAGQNPNVEGINENTGKVHIDLKFSSKDLGKANDSAKKARRSWRKIVFVIVGIILGIILVIAVPVAVAKT